VLLGKQKICSRWDSNLGIKNKRVIFTFNIFSEKVEKVKLNEEKIETEIQNIELENEQIEENLKSLNGELRILSKAGFKIFLYSHTV